MSTKAHCHGYTVKVLLKDSQQLYVSHDVLESLGGFALACFYNLA